MTATAGSSPSAECQAGISSPSGGKGFAWAITRFSVDCVNQQEEARAANRGHALKLLGSAIADQEPVNFKVSRAL